MRWLKSLLDRPSRPTESNAPLLFTNTLTGRKDIFTPRQAGSATLYSCGPTVYSRAHIGNLRAYVFADLVARVLAEAGYRPKRVINITDVGHLVSDADEGEDKMEVGAKREGISAADVALRYAKLFIEDIEELGLDTRSIQFPRATEYIPEQIALVSALEEKGFTYRTEDGIYFDTEKFPGYGVLGGVDTREAVVASIGRRVTENKEKHHPADFALWRFSPKAGKRQQEWPSPWGLGFPGWHAECSAMARALLGQPIDIHTGGMDHIPVHHNDEIAQSEAAYGTPLARYWMHGAFLTIEREKISKSLGNDIYLSDITDKGYHPLSLRYLFLQAHYRTPMSFSWESLAAADEALKRLWKLAESAKELAKGREVPSDESRRMIALLRDDLATPAALALLWEVLKDEDMGAAAVWGVVTAAEPVLGLSLTSTPSMQAAALPPDIVAMLKERDAARAARDFATSDRLRIHIETRGYHVEDRPSGSIATRLPG